jgi:hypothetical protein
LVYFGDLRRWVEMWALVLEYCWDLQRSVFLACSVGLLWGGRTLCGVVGSVFSLMWGVIAVCGVLSCMVGLIWGVTAVCTVVS